MKPLQGKIAVVAGSSRGAGKGIALSLGDAGATVYVAARTSRHGPKPADGAPGTVEDTAEEVSARGGQGIAVRADLGNEEEAAALFRRVEEELNRLVADMGRELKKRKVAVVGLNPGFMRTERVLMHMTTEKIKKQFRFDLSESVEYVGRAAAALAADPAVLRKTGELLWAADLATEYGFTDVDGRVIPVFDPKAP
jgi:NAD(P)-dependent dehydrogenase (short-subunit alcohol dehydrogenase family)